jgi:hypothetical protein
MVLKPLIREPESIVSIQNDLSSNIAARSIDKPRFHVELLRRRAYGQRSLWIAETYLHPILHAMERRAQRLYLPCAEVFQQRSCIAVEHPFPLGFGTIHLLNLFRGHPIAEVVRVIGSDHDVVRADYAL